jgi:hypothetical protein
MWAYTSPSGKSIKKGFDALLPYMVKEMKWTGQQIKEFDFKETIPLLTAGYIHFNCLKCKNSIKEYAEDNADISRIQLLNLIDLK